MTTDDWSQERRYDRALFLGPKRAELVELWEVERYGSEGFGDVDYVCVYGLPPREWYGRGVRLLGRTVVECTRDRLAARISEDVAAVAAGAATGGTVVVDPFAGSANTLFWLARHLDARVAIGFERDDEVAAVTQRNVTLLGLPIVVRHGQYERGIREIRAGVDELVVAFLAPPWGDALSDDGELDLRRTAPPVPEALSRVADAFAGCKLLVATQLYEQVEPSSLAEIASRCEWSSRMSYTIDPPGRNHGLLVGTLGWSPQSSVR